MDDKHMDNGYIEPTCYHLLKVEGYTKANDDHSYRMAALRIGIAAVYALLAIGEEIAYFSGTMKYKK